MWVQHYDSGSESCVGSDGLVSVVMIRYDDVPPSLNTTGTRGSHWVATRLKKRWQTTLEGLLMGSGLPRSLERVEASAFLRFPVRRVRDEGNYRWLLEKSLGDALVNGGWLVDDSSVRFRFGRVEFEGEPGSARTVVRLDARFDRDGKGEVPA